MSHQGSIRCFEMRTLEKEEKMKTIQTTPAQILQAWEHSNQRLSPQYRREFKANKITKKLCQYRLVEIKIAMVVGKKTYLPDILKYVTPKKPKSRVIRTKVEPAIYAGVHTPKNTPQGRLRAVVAIDPNVWAGNFSERYKETSTYNCSVCESPVIGLRCKCALAA